MLTQVLRACALVCILVSPAFAQPADLVATNYALYRAAIERGDSEAAQTAAAAALAESQRRDGEGGNTAILAYNLALVRLDAGKRTEALEPATLALALAERTSSSSLNPLLARLVFGEAQLAASPEEGAATLTSALQSANERHDVDDRAFRAAAALGAWALASERYDLAETAWSQAVAHSPGNAPADILARERARTAQGVAMIGANANNQRAAARDRAYLVLTESLDALYPYAIEQAADGALTPFQGAYAEALGWREYGRPRGTPRQDVTQRDLRSQPVCAIYWSGGQGISALIQGALHAQVGVGVFRMIVNDEGRITSIDTAFASPAQEFSEDVLPYLARLRARRASDAEQGCAMPHVVFHTIIIAPRGL